MTWTPYVEKMAEQLQGLGLSEQASAGGFHRYGGAKITAAALGSRETEGGQYGVCCIIPNAEYVLPIYVSRWDEETERIEMLVDLVPTVDSLVDEAFRVEYLEPLGQLWDKFASLAGICPEEDDALRSVCSIIYTGARVPIEREGMRLAALAPHTEYLKQYAGYVQAATPGKDAARIKEVERRTAAVRRVLAGFTRRTVADGALAEQICSSCY